VYKEEGLPWEEITFFDNKVVCETIEGKPNGIFEVSTAYALSYCTGSLYLIPWYHFICCDDHRPLTYSGEYFMWEICYLILRLLKTDTMNLIFCDAHSLFKEATAEQVGGMPNGSQVSLPRGRSHSPKLPILVSSHSSSSLSSRLAPTLVS